MPTLVAHVKDLLGVVAGNAGEGEGGEDDCHDAGGHEARLEGVLGGGVVLLVGKIYMLTIRWYRHLGYKSDQFKVTWVRSWRQVKMIQVKVMSLATSK